MQAHLQADLEDIMGSVPRPLHKMSMAMKQVSRIFFSQYLYEDFIYFNWRIITIKYCDGFCHTSVCNGIPMPIGIHVYTEVYMCPLHPEPPSNLPPHFLE